mmetsp:Transcript_99463/g.195374  ORF Transcript_99463/g.195374 Transcript_99463/m.195374 type:complete len:192 (+) Transcript_99463:78-653(+)
MSVIPRLPAPVQRSFSDLVKNSVTPENVQIAPQQVGVGFKSTSEVLDVPNLSSFFDVHCDSMLSLYIDELRKRDKYAIVSDAEEIDEIDKIMKSSASTFVDLSEACNSLGSLLLQHSLHDPAYYFYFEAINFAKGCGDFELIHDPLLQMAKMLYVGNITTPNAKGLADAYFSFLIQHFGSEEATSFKFSNN